MESNEENQATERPTLGELGPNWNVEDPHIRPEDALDTFLTWVEGQGLELWPHQEEALLDIATGDHLILGTPTGSGKTMVALGMCFIALCAGERCYYTAPIKALVSEKFFGLVDLFGKDNVGMITGDTVINADAPIICCTEEILAQDSLRFGTGADIGYAVMDEFHFYGDKDRGWAWQVPLLTLPHVHFLLMSATLGDTTAIRNKLQELTKRPVDVIDDAPRPVPLHYQFVDTPLESTVELALKNGQAPIYIVHSSQNAAFKSAQALASYGVSDREQRTKIKEAIKGTRFTTNFGKALKRLLITGVGIHHAGMLPRYRLLVEKLAQQGLLPVICGTDTLGVGINVPIHTVILAQLTKFDGRRCRRISAREFHQVAGRAGRAGFDTEGIVLAEATPYEIEKARALLKVGGDPKKARKVKTKTPPKDFVTWNEQTFTRLIEATPETLTPHLQITNSMVLSEIQQGGDAQARLHELVDNSAQTDEQKQKLHARVDEILATLLDADVIQHNTEDGKEVWSTLVDLPDDFALDQPLSPFLLTALELLDPQSDTYDLDLISMVEATLEDPGQILRAQEHEARDKAIAEMKAEGIDYEERTMRIEDVTYPKPLEDLLNQAFASYCAKVPWAGDYSLHPKSVLRDMIESAADFKSYIQRYKMSRSEGTLLRYLSEAYRVLDRTVPTAKLDDHLKDIIAWLSLQVRSIDSSLFDEWEAAGTLPEDTTPPDKDGVVHDRRGLTILVRNALWHRVRLAQADDAEALGELDAPYGYREVVWQRLLDEFHEAHEDILLDQDARSTKYFILNTDDEKGKHTWSVHQIFRDSDDDHDFGIAGAVDLDRSQEEGECVFSDYHVGFAKTLLEQGITLG